MKLVKWMCVLSLLAGGLTLGGCGDETPSTPPQRPADAGTTPPADGGTTPAADTPATDGTTTPPADTGTTTPADGGTAPATP